MMSQKRAIVMNEKDNTATAVEALEAGSAVVVSIGASAMASRTPTATPSAVDTKLRSTRLGRPTAL